MAYTIKPLGKLYTLIEVVNNIVLWLRKEIQKELDPEFVKVLVNLAVMDVAEILSGAGNSDYSRDVNVTDASTNFGSLVAASGGFVNSTKILTDVGHGLTTANHAGRRILIYYEETTLAPVGNSLYFNYIESIPTADTIKLKNSMENIPAAIYYTILSPHSSEAIDLSIYPISQITKVHDSINNEVVETGDKDFDNIYRFPTKQNKCFYNVRGQTLFLKKGTDVSTFGELTMTYNSYPQKTTENDDNLDIRDMYTPLVILKAKNFCLEHLQITPPESLTNAIDNKSREIRENIQKEKEIANMKNHGK